MKKLLVILLVLVPFSIALTQDKKPRTEWDCNSSKLKVISSNLQVISDLLPEDTKSDNFTIAKNAFSNLKKYCNYNKKVLHTPFFLNHLIDQYFRYLDWIQTNNYHWPLYSTSKQRRTYLNQIAENNFRWINPK